MGGAISLFVFACIMTVKQHKQNIANKKNAIQNNADTTAEPKFETVEARGPVVDQMCYVKTVGIKTPKTVQEFVIVFRTEGGDILKLNVPEEMYDGFEQGQTGILTVVDGDLYSFVPEEAM